MCPKKSAHVIQHNSAKQNQNTMDQAISDLPITRLIGGDSSDAPAKLRTASEVWRQLRADGVSAQKWAQDHGFEPSLVYSVLSGERKCIRGKSHEIAKALGIK